MIRNQYEILTDPSFADALSGEFTPQCDEQNRTHTLGRLMIAAMHKGEIDKEDAGYIFLDYRPSWAQSVEVSVGCLAINSKLNILRADSLELSTDSAAVNFSFCPQRITNQNDVRQHLLSVVGPAGSDFPAYEFELAPTSNSDEIQKVVSQRAQQFFDTV